MSQGSKLALCMKYKVFENLKLRNCKFASDVCSTATDSQSIQVSDPEPSWPSCLNKHVFCTGEAPC